MPIQMATEDMLHTSDRPKFLTIGSLLVGIILLLFVFADVMHGQVGVGPGVTGGNGSSSGGATAGGGLVKSGGTLGLLTTCSSDQTLEFTLGSGWSCVTPELEVDCSTAQFNPTGLNTWDQTLAACLAATSTHDGAIWNMYKVRGNQTMSADPFQSFVGYGGYAPVKSGLVKVGPGNYTLNQDLVLTTGIRFECIEPHEGGASSTQGCNLIPNMPSLYNTGTVSTTAIACPAGVNPCTSTWTFSAGVTLNANMVGERAMVCTSTTTGTLACPSGATGGAAINEGLILSVNTTAKTAVVLIDRYVEGNANASVNYAVYPAFVQLGDGSVAYPAGCTAGTCTSAITAGSNFNTYIGGFAIDDSINGVTGGISLFNRSASNETGIDNTMTIIPYDGEALYIGGPASQNTGPYGSEHSHWITTGNGPFPTQHTAQGVIVRNTGAPVVHIENLAVALSNAVNGSNTTGIDTCAFCIGSQVALGPGLKGVLGPGSTSGNNVKNTTSIGVDINDGVTCYVACEDPEGDSSGGYLIGFTSTSGGAAAVKLGNTTATLTGYHVGSVVDDNSPPSAIPYILIDSANSVNVPYNDNASNSLQWYDIDANSKSHTSAACSGCNTYVLAAGQLPATTVYNNQANTYSAGLQNFNSATIDLPSVAACAPTTASQICYDSTNNRIVFGNGTTTGINLWTTATPSSNVLPKWFGALGQTTNSSIADNGVKVASSEFLQFGNTQLLTADSSGIIATTAATGTAVFTWGALPVSTNFAFHCSGTYTQATAAGGVSIAIQGATNAPTRIDAWASLDSTNPASTTYTGTKAGLYDLTTTTATLVAAVTPGVAATQYQWEMHGAIEVGASASNLKIIFFSGSASDSVVIKAGSFCALTP